MCPTRWTARTAAIEAILKDYELLIETLEEVHQSTQDEYGMKAGGLQRGLEKFNMFFLPMVLPSLIQRSRTALTNSPKKKEISLQDAFCAVGSSKIVL